MSASRRKGHPTCASDALGRDNKGPVFLLGWVREASPRLPRARPDGPDKAAVLKFGHRHPDTFRRVPVSRLESLLGDKNNEDA